jgi:hypothetical protein
MLHKKLGKSRVLQPISETIDRLQRRFTQSGRRRPRSIAAPAGGSSGIEDRFWPRRWIASISARCAGSLDSYYQPGLSPVKEPPIRCLIRMQIERSPSIAALATSTDQIKREVAIRFAKGRAFLKQMSTHRNLISNHAESSGARRSKLIFCEWVRGGSHLHPFVAGGRCNVCLSYFENQRNLVWRVVAISGERAAYRFNERRGRPGSFGVKRSPSRQLRHDSPR